MKKVVSLLLTAGLVFTCAACGSNGGSNESTTPSSDVQESSEAGTDAESEAQDSSGGESKEVEPQSLRVS